MFYDKLGKGTSKFHFENSILTLMIYFSSFMQQNNSTNSHLNLINLFLASKTHRKWKLQLRIFAHADKNRIPWLFNHKVLFLLHACLSYNTTKNLHHFMTTHHNLYLHFKFIFFIQLTNIKCKKRCGLKFMKTFSSFSHDYIFIFKQSAQ